MKCPKCDAEVNPDAVYCHVCGARLDEAVEGAPVAEGKESFNRRVEARQVKKDTAEEELWQGGFSAKAMVGTWVHWGIVSIVALAATGILFPFALFGVGPAVLLLWAYFGIQFAMRRLGLHYRLTNQRFFHESGILSRTTNRIEVIDMDDITFTQGFVDRFFGVGTIKVSSTDITHPVLTIEGIDDVQRVAGLIDNARRAERLRRGLHIETV